MIFNENHGFIDFTKFGRKKKPTTTTKESVQETTRVIYTQRNAQGWGIYDLRTAPSVIFQPDLEKLISYLEV